jgi:hypothetical protein
VSKSVHPLPSQSNTNWVHIFGKILKKKENRRKIITQLKSTVIVDIER